MTDADAATVHTVPLTPEMGDREFAQAPVTAYAQIPMPRRAYAVWVAGMGAFPRLGTLAPLEGTIGQLVWVDPLQDPPAVRVIGRPVIFTERYTDDRIEIWDRRPEWASR